MSSSPGTVAAVNVARSLVPSAHSTHRTGIDKQPVPGPVRVTRLGLEPDRIGSKAHHGGPDMAVYAYAVEEARRWERDLGRRLPPGAFGENLTTAGVDVSGAVLGETWRVGGTVLRVRMARIPCRTFAAHWGVPDLVRRFTDAGLPGAYLGVDVEGEVCAGDAVEVLERPVHGVTVAELFAALLGHRDLVDHVLRAGPDLTGLAWNKLHRLRD